MPVSVKNMGDRIVIEVEDQRIVLPTHRAKLLLVKLAQALGAKITYSKPVVVYQKIGRLYSVQLYEGKEEFNFVLPQELIEAYLEAIKELGKASKRELAEKAICEKYVKKYDDVDAENLCKSSNFWKLLMGSRALYYKLFRAPVALLEKMGAITTSKNNVYLRT